MIRLIALNSEGSDRHAQNLQSSLCPVDSSVTLVSIVYLNEFTASPGVEMF